MLVYKYVVPERVDVIEKGCIRFTQAAALNDPFETYPCFNLFKESLKERSRSVLQTVEHRFNARSAVIGSIMIPKLAQDKTIELQRGLSTQYPLLSLTKKRNNLLMWSHYTNAHRGFVIGFDSEHSFFHRDKPRKMTSLSEVNYSKKRPVVPPFEEFEREPEAVNKMLFLTKSDHWAYEEELRMLAKPEEANLIKKDENGCDIYLYKFPPAVLKEIIFGHLMRPPLKQRISDIVEENYSHVELFEAQLSEHDFDLNIVPYLKRRLKTQEKQPAAKFAVCINNDGYPASLELHKIYRVLPDEDATSDGDIRVVDESGEDYLCPAEYFVLVELPRAVEKSLMRAALSSR